jgi:Fe-S cluster biosynthesis and repair protein YggX
MITCTRCGQEAETTVPAHRVPFTGPAKERIVSGICGPCWKEWEGVEVKVINEYRLNFLDPQHRDMLKRTCLEFLKLPIEG